MNVLKIVVLIISLISTSTFASELFIQNHRMATEDFGRGINPIDPIDPIYPMNPCPPWLGKCPNPIGSEGDVQSTDISILPLSGEFRSLFYFNANALLSGSVAASNIFTIPVIILPLASNL